MKNIILRIKEYLQKKAVQKRMRRIISVLASIVVFSTTYALLLPGLTLESKAICGMEEHQHTKDCYEEVLTCDKEESDGHQHSESCYNEAGELICGQEESEGHHHDDSCYESVLTCGKEVHIHTKDCYAKEEPEEAAEEPTEDKSADDKSSEETNANDQSAQEDNTQDTNNSDDSADASADNAGNSEDGSAGGTSGGAGASDEADANGTGADVGLNGTDADSSAKTAQDADELAEADIAESEKLSTIEFRKFLTDDTTLYYHPEGAGSDVWEPIDPDVRRREGYGTREVYIEPDDDILIHIAYELPAGTINETNAETEYRLPLLLEMSSDEVNDNNKHLYQAWNGTDRESNALTEAGRYEIKEKRSGSGELTDRWLVINWNEETSKKCSGEKLTDGTVTAKPSKVEGFLELRISAEELLTLEKVDEKTKEGYAASEGNDAAVTNEGKEGAATGGGNEGATAGEGNGGSAADEDGAKAYIYKLYWGKDNNKNNDLRTTILFDGAAVKKWNAPEDSAEEETAAEADEMDELNLDASVITADGETYKVTVSYDADSGIPADATLDVKEIAEDSEEYAAYLDEVQAALEAGKKVRTAKLFDITILDSEGNKIEPATPVRVNIEFVPVEVPEGTEVELYHFKEEDAAPQVMENVELQKDEADTVNGLEFETDGFSVYGVVYTVDFHWEVDGKTFEFSIPGGGFVSFYRLVELLGIEVNDTNTEADEIQELVDDVENIEFSDPSLVSVSKVEENTTVGAIKDRLGLECLYSAELSQEQVAEINAQEAKVGDWALISMKPFDTEESLTVTMKNGEQFVVRVTDAKIVYDISTVDVNKTYLIGTKVGESYHLLKTDGTQAVVGPNSFDKLDSSYQWTLYYVFTEKDRETSLDYTYYFIRPVADRSKTIALNEVGEDLVQEGTNNIAVIPQGDGGFVFLGYNHSTDKHIELGFDEATETFAAYNDSKYLDPDDDPTIIRIFEQEPLPQYSFTVKTADASMGLVSGLDESGHTASNVSEFIGLTNDAKKNPRQITAVPVQHQNAGQNKYIFDHWELDGVRLNYGTTIPAGELEIPKNSSVLEAVFAINPSYVFPDDEKQGSPIIDMQAWLNELRERNVPLSGSGTRKTAEVYDYENRIYRVDLTAQSSLTTFDGTIDLGFMLDVSASMLFPSKLVKVQGKENLNIYRINGEWRQNQFIDDPSHKQWLDQSKTYYLIGDERNTATVFRLFFYNNYWYAIDASKYTGNNATSAALSDSFVIGRDSYKTAWIHSASYYPLTTDDTINSTYTIYQDGDSGRQRLYYLENSMSNTVENLNDILNVLSVASSTSQNPDVKIAYNTFNSKIQNYEPSFQSASAFDRSAFDNLSTAGGTSTDYALGFADTQNVDKSAATFQWENSATKYAVLITDGAPQRSGTAVPSADVINAAQNLKDKGVKLITVGLSMGNVDRGRILLYDLADKIGDEKMFFNAESGDELENVLLQIISMIMEDATVQGDVTDTVNEAFYPVNKATGMPLEDGAFIDLEGNLIEGTPSGAYGEIVKAGNTYQIKWKNQDFTWEGWHGTVYVKAKEDLLGGNAVKTNSGNAIVEAKKYKTDNGDLIDLVDKKYIDGDPSKGEDPKYNRFAELESPRVNINELSFTHSETDWTVYLGTNVDPKEQLKALYNQIKVEEVVTGAQDTNGDGLPDTMSDAGSHWYPLSPDSIVDNREGEGIGNRYTFLMKDLIKKLAEKGSYDWWNSSTHEPNWDVFLTQAIAEGGITIPYHEYGLNDNSNIKISLVKVIKSGEEEDLVGKSPHTTTVTGDEVEKYTLSIVYSPDYDVLPKGQGGSSTEPFHTGTYGTLYQGHAAGTEDSTNVHVINVYAKTVEVDKLKPVGEEETALLTDKQATFGLYRKWMTTDGESIKTTLDGYTTKDGQSFDEDDFFVLLETKETENGKAKFTAELADLGTEDGVYYIAETEAPEGYAENKVLQTVTVTPGPNTTTTKTASPTTKTEEGNITTAMPYDWTQGVRFYFDGSETPAVYVDGDGVQVVPTTATEEVAARDYVLPTDTDGYFRTTVLNTPLGYLRIHKSVKYNGQTPSTAEQRNVLKGTYTFKIYTDQNCTLPVLDGNSEMTLTVVIEDDGTAKYSNTVSLPIGTYWLKEIVSDDSYVLPVGTNPQEIEIKAENTSDAPKTVEVTNDYEFNEEDDNIAIDIVKKFTGITSETQIPEGYKVVLSYEHNGTAYTVDLGNSSYVTPNGVQVKVNKTEDGLTWTWHVYNIPKGSTNFRIHEENYDKTGYDLAAYIDGKKADNPDQDHALNVQVPNAVLTEVIDKRITSETDLRTYYVGSDYVILVSLNPSGTLVISDKSLNFLQRSAIENAVKAGRVQGSFSQPVSFFSTEQHPATIRIDRKRVITVSTDSSGKQTVYLPPNTNSMAAGFYVKYDNESVYNNCEIENRYTETGVELDIFKVDANDMETPLEKAQFELNKLDPEGRGSYASGDAAVKKTSGETDKDGKTSITEITEGYYEISEIKMPAGYVKIEDGKFYIWVSDGVIKRIIPTKDDPNTDIDESKVKNWTVLEDNNDGTIRFSSAHAATVDNLDTSEDESADAENAKFIVGNTPGAVLPDAGGPGTTLLYLLGIMFAGFAGAGLVMKKRMKNAA